MTVRISAVDPATADDQTKDLFSAVKSKFGMIPNTLKTLAHSPAALQAYMSLSGALGKGVLAAKTREQVALAVSQSNGCEYCLSAHTLTAKFAGLQPDQISNARRGLANDVKQQAALTLAMNIVEQKGNVTDEELAAARNGGLSDAELVEVVSNIALMTLTNFLNNLAHTDIDFPKVSLSLS